MRILFIFHLSTLKGGANVSGLNLIRGLKELGHDVKVLVPVDGELCLRLEEMGIEYRKIFFRTAWPYTLGSAESYIKFFPRAIRNWNDNRRAVVEITRWVREINPDIIHSNSSVISIGNRVARKLGIPHVTHFREFGFRDTRFFGWHIPGMRKYALQYNISISKDIELFHRLKDNRSELIYNGIYSLSEYPDALRANKKKGEYFLYVGGIFESKGIDDILEAYSRLSPELRNEHPLWLAGSPNSQKYMQSLLQKVKDLGMERNIVWLGQRRDIAELMSRAKALIIASHAEAFGRIMAEAAFNKCPVIARDACGLHEQFEQGLNTSGREIGLRFKTVDDLSNQMKFVLTMDADELQEMLNAGFKTACTLYSNESYAESVSEFYKRIQKNNRKHSCK